MIPADRKILNSWKEIAQYLVRGIRTVQRWERHFGLPVHRPSAEPRSAVLAFSDEIDQWLAATPVATVTQHAGARLGLPERTRELLADMQSKTVTLIRGTRKLQDNVLRACEQQQRWMGKKRQSA